MLSFSFIRYQLFRVERLASDRGFPAKDSSCGAAETQEPLGSKDDFLRNRPNSRYLGLYTPVVIKWDADPLRHTNDILELKSKSKSRSGYHTRQSQQERNHNLKWSYAGQFIGFDRRKLRTPLSSPRERADNKSYEPEPEYTQESEFDARSRSSDSGTSSIVEDMVQRAWKGSSGGVLPGEQLCLSFETKSSPNDRMIPLTTFVAVLTTCKPSPLADATANIQAVLIFELFPNIRAFF